MSTPAPAVARPTASREELYETCRHIATSPNVLDGFIAELNRAGFVGEERASRLIYLALVSRLFKDPVSLAIKGPSSGGKSHTAQQALNFFPPESYYAMSSMSERALAYLNEPLSHRFLVIYEAAGMNGEYAYLIRTLLSEGCFIHRTLVQTKDEGWQTRELRVEGPTGLLTTTTLVSLHAENETRLLSVPINDSPEQTRRIMRAMAHEGGRDSIDYTPWHAFQRWLALGSHEVTIPFGDWLADNMYCGSVRGRRDFRKLLTLVRSHALLHQANRAKDSDGRIMATSEDYGAVRPLVADLFAEAAERGVKQTVRETVEAVAALITDDHADVSITTLARTMGLDKGTVSRRVDDALKGGYLVNGEERKGVPAKLVVGDPLPEEQEVLPQADALAA